MNSLDFLKGIHREDLLFKYFNKFGKSLVFDSKDQKWIEHYLKLQEFEKTHGHTKVPVDYVQDDFRLGKWVSKQRRTQKNGHLLPYRRDLLNMRQGWNWKVKPNQPWETWFSILKKYVERKGNARVPGGHIENGHRLGGWVSVQRQTYQNGKLTIDRVRKLESLTGWIWEARLSWEIWFSKLIQFVSQEGHACVPQSYLHAGLRLGGWVSTQRDVFQKGMLSEDRIANLESLPGWTWDATRAMPWESWFSILQQFTKREGHPQVPYNHMEKGKRIGLWCRRQRNGYRNGQLASEQITKLESLPGWIWAASER